MRAGRPEARRLDLPSESFSLRLGETKAIR